MVDHHRVWNLAYLAGFAGLLIATFANYALQELGHDEGMYLGASYLAIDHDLYTDLGYFQAPNLPLLLSRFYAWSGVSHLLMWGRVVTFVHHALTLTLMGATAWYFTQNSLVTFVFVLWIGLNGFLYGAGYSIDNTTFASTYLLAGYYALLRAHARDWKSMTLVAASGFFVALAPGFKLNYFSFFVCFVAVVGLFSTRRSLATFLIGSLVGFTPMIYMSIARASAFWFDNVVWHRQLLALNVEELGAHATATRFATDALFYLARPAWLAIPVLLAGVALALFFWERMPFWSFERTLLSSLIAVSLVTIGGLGAVRFWYLQPAALVGALILPSVYSQLHPTRQTVARIALVVAAVMGVLMQAPSLRNAPDVLAVDDWVPLRYSANSADVAALLRQRRPHSVAVIGNPAIVYGVEGALPLVPAAATGSFVRVSSPILARRSLRDDTIATYEGLSNSDPDMVVATTDYVLPRALVAADAWCHPDRPEGSFDTLFDRLCRSGYETVVVGDGPSRAVVFYR